MSVFKEGLYYAKSHEWLRVEGEEAYIGITDFAQSELGDIVYVEADTVGEELDSGSEFGSVESVKMASDLYMPVSGEVLAFNEALEDEAELLNQDAFENWIIKIKINDQSELDELMSAEQYRALVEV